ncbi:MAG: S9 family peptidase [Armatimonadetes bacterium]|nr:S9 family peptidase [Armatimonadota bacterium]
MNMVKWTAKDLVGLKVPTEVSISPKGDAIAFVVREPDWDLGVMQFQLWLWRNGKLSQWTFGDKAVALPKFSPDGKWLAFLAKPASDDQGKQQIWLAPLDGGEPRPLTNADEGIVTFAWHPDGSAIWCVIPEPKTEEQKRLEEINRKRRADLTYHDEALPDRSIWRFKLPDGEGEKFFTGDAGIYELSISPDGKRLVFATTFTGKRDDWRRSKLFWLLIDESDEQPKPLCDRNGAQFSPRFSPDGKTVAFLSLREPERSFSHQRIFVADFDGNWHELSSLPDLEVEGMLWAKSGIFSTLSTGTTSQIWRLSESEATPVSDSDWLILNFDVTADGENFAAIKTDDRNLPQVWLGKLEGDKLSWEQISDFNLQVKKWRLPKAKIVNWQSDDGSKIEGVLWLPPSETSTSPLPPCPTIVWVHGGPKSRATKALLSATGIPLFLAANGYAVLMPNFRGSSGYDNAFATANFRDLGGKDFHDILAGVRWAIAQGIADPERIGIVGGSYGGYMTSWALAQSEIFKAGVSLYGIALLFSDFGNSDNPSWEPDYLGAFPWEAPELYLERSPLIHAHKIKAPLLLLHGESDKNTFISNSQELYTALKKLGRTVEFVRYPREGHGFREPNHLVDTMERILVWFDRWLKGDAFASAVPVGEKASDGELQICVAETAKSVQPINIKFADGEKLTSVNLTIAAVDKIVSLNLTKDVWLFDANGRSYPPAGLVQTEGESCWLIEGDLRIELPTEEITLVLAFRLPADIQPAAVKFRQLTLRVR